MSDDVHYKKPGWFTRNVLNKLISGLTSSGLSVSGSRVLEVNGRKSGQPRRTPVNLLRLDGKEFLVSPHGETEWVKNVRASGGRLGPTSRAQAPGVAGDRARRRRANPCAPCIPEEVEVRGRGLLRRVGPGCVRRAIPGHRPQASGILSRSGLLRSHEEPRNVTRHMERATVEIYEDRGDKWAAGMKAERTAAAEEFGSLVAQGRPRIDIGCGAGRYTGLLGSPCIGLDAARSMLQMCTEAAPQALLVQADMEALPFGARTVDAAWANMSYLHLPRKCLPAALARIFNACSRLVRHSIYRSSTASSREPGFRTTGSVVGSSPHGTYSHWSGY